MNGINALIKEAPENPSLLLHEDVARRCCEPKSIGLPHYLHVLIFHHFVLQLLLLLLRLIILLLLLLMLLGLYPFVFLYFSFLFLLSVLLCTLYYSFISLSIFIMFFLHIFISFFHTKNRPNSRVGLLYIH